MAGYLLLMHQQGVLHGIPVCQDVCQSPAFCLGGILYRDGDVVQENVSKLLVYDVADGVMQAKACQQQRRAAGNAVTVMKKRFL